METSTQQRHLFSLEEYHRMAEADVFGPDDRIELLDGELYEKMTMHAPHASVVEALNELFSLRLVTRAKVRCQLPVTLRPNSEPEPDLAVVTRADYSTRHPEADDVYLLAEVAHRSLEEDRRLKLPIYARAGVREVWLVDVNSAEITVHRDPAGAWYTSRQTVHTGDAIAPLAFSDVEFTVDEIFGRR